MAAARCANGLASIAREFDAHGVRAICAATMLPAQLDHAHELFGGVDDLDSPLVEAARARRLIQLQAKPGEEPAEHLERHDAGVVAGQVNPLPDVLIRIAIEEADLPEGFQHVDGSGKPVNADRQGSIGVPEFTDSPVRRGESQLTSHHAALRCSIREQSRARSTSQAANAAGVCSRSALVTSGRHSASPLRMRVPSLRVRPWAMTWVDRPRRSGIAGRSPGSMPTM